jgi:hypothetical protein
MFCSSRFHVLLRIVLRFTDVQALVDQFARGKCDFMPYSQALNFPRRQSQSAFFFPQLTPT